MMMYKVFLEEVEKGSQFVMRKYKAFGEWSKGRVVDSETALRKSRVTVYDEDGDAYCPYSFELA